MRNSYETSEAVELGKSSEVILGQKPDSTQDDSIVGPRHQTFPDSQDIDETDE